jgi:hypothetical protein
LGTDFAEYFGNLYPEGLLNCANFHNDSNTATTIESLSVAPAPIQAAPDCDPGGEGAAPVSCSPGVVLEPGETSPGCRFGVQLPPGPDTLTNHLADNTWVLSTVCTSAVGDPSVDACATQAVKDRGPTPSDPVRVRLEYVFKIRYCGGTGYSNGPGAEPGVGGPPENGCV